MSRQPHAIRVTRLQTPRTVSRASMHQSMHIRRINGNAALTGDQWGQTVGQTGDKEVVPIEGRAHAAYTLTSKVCEFVGAARADHCYTTLGAIHHSSQHISRMFSNVVLPTGTKVARLCVCCTSLQWQRWSGD